MNAMRGRVSQSGRVGLPAELRRAVGLDQGGDVVIELDNGDIRIRTVRQVVGRAQALSQQLLAGKADTGLEAFLAERRKGAEHEG